MLQQTVSSAVAHALLHVISHISRQVVVRQATQDQHVAQVGSRAVHVDDEIDSRGGGVKLVFRPEQLVEAGGAVVL